MMCKVLYIIVEKNYILIMIILPSRLSLIKLIKKVNQFKISNIKINIKSVTAIAVVDWKLAKVVVGNTYWDRM